MTSEQIMNQAMIQAVIEATEAAIMAVRETESPTKKQKTSIHGTKSKDTNTEMANIWLVGTRFI